MQWNDKVYLDPECRERFLTQSDIPELSSSHIHMAGLANLRNSYHVERANPSYHTLIYSIHGAGILYVEDEQLAIPSGHLAFLPAHKPFRFVLDPQSGHWDMAWLILDRSQLWASLSERNAYVTSAPHAELLWGLLTVMFHDMQQRKSHNSTWIEQLEDALQFSLASHSKPDASDRVRHIIRDASLHLHRSQSVSEMAAQAHLSNAHFTRICQQLYQQSPKQYLLKVKMQRAAELLTFTNWSVSSIASQLGYDDPFTFTHRFNAFYKQAPRDYRKAQLHK
ncbi:AraC family transcriptional regulator [Alginatibacterium sediminis]|uniref:AraC family transcriptional regulator n=1 Tax=Alginatibacterium sediminis TaxID=2164068 RepID=A0A420E6A2_9ALTE|nr:AraC family transcriptional regulator [Alginatibacterium sediminis]RKF13220.1 AraC family transcriptional regulator [Alginatibacterium sediminis]